MNANQFNGTVKGLLGRVQEQAGQLVGSKTQMLRGLQRQVLGAAEKRQGDCEASAQRALGHGKGVHQ